MIQPSNITGHLERKFKFIDHKQCSRELNSVSKDNAYYMQGLGFEPQTPQKKKKIN